MRGFRTALMSGTLAAILLELTVVSLSLPPQRSPKEMNSADTPGLGSGPLLIGYWHNFVNGAGFLQLRDVSGQFDVINIAFGTPVSGSTSFIGFTLEPLESETKFIADIALLHSRGKKVLLSIGGADAPVKLNASADLQGFVSSVGALVNKFGFDGIDIDFESGSVTLTAGDIDFKNPTTHVIVNLISALHELKNTFGPGFIISLAPGTFEIQGGFRGYAVERGAYLPVIFGILDILSYVHVQDYNSGTMFGLDGRVYAQGTADFHVAMSEMLLQGFAVAGNANNVFPALRPDQVAFGVPANQSAGGGFTNNTELRNALTYLIRGVSFGGQYQLRNSTGYPGFRGLMTWSINWDSAADFSLSNGIGPYLHGLGSQPGEGPVISAVTAVRKNLVVTGLGFDRGAAIVVNGQDRRTDNDEDNPSTVLIGKKLVKKAPILRGNTVAVQVRNSSGALSGQFQFTRPN